MAEVPGPPNAPSQFLVTRIRGFDSDRWKPAAGVKLTGVATYIGPNPIVSRREILRSLDPIRRGSPRARFQTLRDKKVVSAGVRRPLATSKGRFRGSIHLFSTLNRDAVRLYRQGRQSEARAMALEATALEAQGDFQSLVDILATFAATNQDALRSVAEFPWQAVRAIEITNTAAQQMLNATASAAQAIRQANRALEQMSRVVGWVESIEQNLAWIRTLEDTLASFPAIQLRTAGLDRVGTAVEIEWEQVDPGEMVISTSGAIGSAEVSSELWTAFNPPERIRVSDQRWALLQSQLRATAVAIPSAPVHLPRRR